MTDEDTTQTADEPRSEREEGGPTGTGTEQGDEAGQEGRGHGDKPSGFEPHE
jgi:hypothetical protein